MATDEYIGEQIKSANSAFFQDFLERSRDTNFSPDVNGYTLIYMVPPVLSGIEGGQLWDLGGQFPFLAVDFTPPESTVKSSEETSRSSIGISYSTGTSSGGQLSINFIEDSNLTVTKYHNTWVGYIGDIVYGYAAPSDDYINSGKLDYATSAYVVKFRPDMRSATYIGKATGIFPLNVPSKEVLGNRQSNELTMVGLNYNCAMYSAYIVGEGTNSWVKDELNSDLNDYFGFSIP